MKKSLLIFLFFHFSLFTCLAQGTWSPITYFPSSIRGEGIGFTIGKYGYMGLGSDYNTGPQAYYKDFWQFDPSTNSWTRKADYPGTGRAWPATFVIGTNGYVVTGRDSTGNNYVTECWQYNSITDTWTQKTNFPGMGRWCATGFSIGGKGYVGNGFPSPNGTDFWAYDTATDSWDSIASFGGHGRWCASGFSVAGNGYVCFGQDHAGKLYRDMWKYDTASNSWTQKNNIPGDSMYGANGFVIGLDIYVGTGQGVSANDYKTFWQYTTVSDTWLQQASYPGVRYACSAFAIGDTGYMGLGWDSVPAGIDYDTNSVYRFIPDNTSGVSRLFDSENQIIVFPNPFDISCYILLPPNSSNSRLEFTLYDMVGRKTEVNISYSHPYFILNRDNLGAGIYLLSIGSANGTYYKKLIITN